MIATLQTFTTALATYQTSISDYLKKTATTLDYVTNKDGLLANTLCLFIGDALDNMFDALCPGFFTSFWGLSKILIVLAFGLYFGTFCIWCTAMKYAKN